MQISLTGAAAKTDAVVILATKKTDWKKLRLSKTDTELVQSFIKKSINEIRLQNKLNYFVSIIETKTEAYKTDEELRKAGFRTLGMLNRHKLGAVVIQNETGIADASLNLAEGMAMGNYQFIKYRKEAKKETNSLNRIKLLAKDATKEKVEKIQAIVDGVYMVRNLVNEPVNYLNAEGLAAAIVAAGKEAGFKTTVFDKKKITELKMGGLLSVNQGSVDPPTFSIMEYKPANAVNKKPIVLVGKGVTYDTGGLSIKPTGNSMDYMKSDMAGAATVTGAIYAVAKTKLPVHVIGLVPSTDNRLNGNAFAPGDIVTMYNGMTIEMLNSDAEGRMILGDALAYAKQYDPELVIDLATLTGAAHAAVGNFAIVSMGTADEATNKELQESGNDVYERMVNFPLWDEYGDLLKSDIADMKNVGGPLAGAITAGKFLEKFTSYPWIHLDIAGIAYFHASMGYKGKNGSGFGLRLLYRFLEKRASHV